MNVPEDMTSDRVVRFHWSTTPLAVASLGGAIAAMLTFVTATQESLPPPPFELLPTAEVVPTVSRDVVRAAFFDSDVEPRICETDAANRQAADRCTQRLTQVVDQYREGVTPFVRDLTSLSTRLGIARRMPGNWWKADKRIDAYVQEKFEEHLFSRERLTRDVAGVLDGFRAEVDANQRRMLVSVRASLSTADVPDIQIEGYEPFFDSVAAQLRSHAADQGTNSVYNGLTVLVVSEVGSYAAVTVVAGLLARFGTAAATTAVAGAGATAGATATGAGGGSLAGPVGTVVGLGVGLAVGLAIDWWMTEKFEKKFSVQMNDYLDQLERTMLHGSPSTFGSIGSAQSALAKHGGIAEALPEICDRLLVAYRERFYEQIVLAESSQ